MSAKVTSLSDILGSTFGEREVEVTMVRVPCPGIAHKTEETCLVCDAETNGTIDVCFTSDDRDALTRAAHGLPLDANLALRLHRLGLLEVIEATYMPTTEGFAILGDISPISLN